MAADLREQYRLRARLPVYRRRVARAVEVIRSGLELGSGYAAFSGGKDSLAMLGLTWSIRPDIPAYFFDSGAETPDTLGCVRQMSERGPVIILHPRLSIVDMCRSAAWWGSVPDGAPVVWGRSDWRRILLEEPAAVARQASGPVQFLGLRKEENRNRLRLLCSRGPIYTRKGGEIIACPIQDWEGADVLAYCLANGLPLSPIYTDPADDAATRERRRTGTALGTSYATYGRFQDLRRRHPAFFAELAAEFPRLRRLA